MVGRGTQAGDEDEDTTEKLTSAEIDTLLDCDLDDSSLAVSLAKNDALFHAWVPQPSPCCAAAVLAGALNVLAATHTWSHRDILPYYVEMTESRIATQKKKLLATMTCLIRETESEPAAWSNEDLNKFTTALRSHLRESYGAELGSTAKKRVKLTKALLLRAARECMDSTSDAVRSVVFPDVDWTGEEHETLPLPPEDQLMCGSTPTSFVIPARSSQKATSSPRQTQQKRCQQELYEYLHLVDGRDKLTHFERPSTAICGNAALVFAVAEIVSRKPGRVLGDGGASSTLRVELLMGLAGPGVVCELKADDNDERHDEQWRTLWRAFNSDRNVLVFHLKNHYALVFSLREWISSDQVTHREILTARRGQRPSAWISWREAHATMTAWRGYKMMCISQTALESA